MPREPFVDRELRVDFTESEVNAFGATLAVEERQYERLRTDHKEAKKEMKKEEEAAEKKIGQLARYVTDRYDIRPVRCRVEYNTPRSGVKRISRTDTGELVEEVPMEAHERQEVIPGVSTLQ